MFPNKTESGASVVGKLQVKSYHMGLKIVTVAAEDWDFKTKIETFCINFHDFIKIILDLVLRQVSISAAHRHQL